MTPSSSDKSVKRETISKPIFSSLTPQSKQFPQAVFAADFSIEEGARWKRIPDELGHVLLYPSGPSGKTKETNPP